VHGRDQVILQHFPRPQSGNRHMLLPVVGIDRRLMFHRRAQILNVVVSSLHHAAVLLEHADVSNLHALVGRVVAQLQLAPLLHARLALHPDARNRFLAASPVSLKTVMILQLLDDKRFLRVILLRIHDGRRVRVGQLHGNIAVRQNRRLGRRFGRSLAGLPGNGLLGAGLLGTGLLGAGGHGQRGY